jgi:endonuclease/exonuclease/phosphatase (EEP) superfamily protein YafD
MRRPGRLALAAALFATLAVVTVQVAGPLVGFGPFRAPVAHASGARMAILQFNMCGWSCGTGLTVAHDVESSINRHSPQPDVVTLEEVCQSQYEDIYATLTPYYGRFFSTIQNKCGSGDNYGIAILVRTSNFTYLGERWLPKTSGEDRKLGCISTNAFGGPQPLVACVTHITTVQADQSAQIAFVASKARSYYAGNHVPVGGDFNVVPAHPFMNPMYNSHYLPAGSGVFAEADLPYQGDHHSSCDGCSVNEFTSCGGQHIPCSDPPLLSRQHQDRLHLPR